MSTNPATIGAAYKLTNAFNHLKKTKKIFEDLEVLNYKIEGDLYCLLQFCHDQISKLKNEKEYVD